MKKFESFIPYARPSISHDDIQLVNQALMGTSLTRGPWVEQFEKDIASYCGAKHAVCFNSGTTALHAAYFSVNGTKDDTLITTPNTFAATIIGGVLNSSHIELADIDLSSGNMSIENQRSKAMGRAIYIPVHFSGNVVDIASLQVKDGDIIIEDAAHALGSYDNENYPIGSCRQSDMTVLSFHPAKSITTGEGGMVTTNNSELAEKLRLFRNNGIVRPSDTTKYPGFYEVHHVTGNFNFTDFQAALGISQLKRLPAFVKKRHALVQEYRKHLEGHKYIHLFSESLDNHSAHHLFVAQIDFKAAGKTRCEIMEQLKAMNIGTQVHYIPLYHHPFFKKPYRLLNMEKYFEQAITLPLYYDLEPQDVETISKTLLGLL